MGQNWMQIPLTDGSVLGANQQFEVSESTIASTRTPFAIFGVERKIYTRRNWVGINPFVFISGVQVGFVNAGEQRRMRVQVNRTRSFLFAMFWPICVFFATRQVAPFVLRIAVVAGVAIIAWLIVAEFLGGRLLRGEIAQQVGSK